ncbi:MAG: hypothetical protein EOP19_00570 [Hyphomicrobiales bacterium]|nr:MAG: hypothetical protein EOP19_00570 [Hyphomicrobiales bacterium]
MTNHVSDTALDAIKAYPTALITDALKRLKITRAWATGLSRISRPAARLVGRAVILNYARVGTGSGKNLTGQFDVIEECGPGDVLLYAALGVDAWLIGDNVANYTVNRGVGGIVVDGGARDADDLAGNDLPVFARSVSASPYSSEIWLEALNRPTDFANAHVKPGDIVVGDGDGVVIIPADRLDDVLEQLADLEGIDRELAESIARRAPLAEVNAIAVRKGVLYSA